MESVANLFEKIIERTDILDSEVEEKALALIVAEGLFNLRQLVTLSLNFNSDPKDVRNNINSHTPILNYYHTVNQRIYDLKNKDLEEINNG